MKINAKELTKAITTINKLVVPVKTLDVLNYYDITVKAHIMNIATVDYKHNSTVITVCVNAPVDAPDCNLQFDRAYITALIQVNRATKAEVINVDESKARINVDAEDNNIMPIQPDPGAGFDVLPYNFVWEGNSDILINLARFTSEDDLRPALQCVAIHAGALVTTNGHFLHALNREKYGQNTTLLLPGEVCAALPKGENCIITANATHYKLRAGLAVEYAGGRLDVDYMFPNWERVIPKDAPFKVEITPEHVKQIASVKVPGKDAKLYMVLRPDVLYFCTDENIEAGINAEIILRVPVKVSRGQDYFNKIVLKFYFKYFTAIWNSAALTGAPVSMQLTDSGSCIYLTAGNSNLLLMPIRIDTATIETSDNLTSK